jgi:hypothetical protein
MIPRDVSQTLITKLDLGHVTVSAAKCHAARYGFRSKARTRADLARDIGRAMTPATERVQLLDGEADQCLVPGVAPVPLALRQCEQEAKRRQARRLGNTLPAGGLFDETARAQADLF